MHCVSIVTVYCDRSIPSMLSAAALAQNADESKST